MKKTTKDKKIDVSNSSSSELKWHEKLFLKIFIGMALLVAIIISPKIKKELKIRSDVKRKLRYFNPIIKQGFWGTSVTWVGREKPLTDDELKKLL